MKTVLIYHPDVAYLNRLLALFQTALPAHRVAAWTADEAGEYLLTWKPEAKIFRTPQLSVVFGLGAGVDAFLSEPSLPETVTIVRLEEAGMGAQMLEMALYGILHHARDMIQLNRGQKNKQWLMQSTPKHHPFSSKIGVMGQGQLGGYVAEKLATIGYSVSGYSRTEKQINGVKSYSAASLEPFLASSEVLINLMPLTEQTENILNAQLFAKLPKGAYVINLARGKHLVETDLIQAMNSGQIAGALLDVFRVEPLPSDHAFWHGDRVTITPHLAAITLQEEAVRQISQNILSLESGQAMTGVVDRKRGY